MHLTVLPKAVSIDILHSSPFLPMASPLRHMNQPTHIKSLFLTQFKIFIVLQHMWQSEDLELALCFPFTWLPGFKLRLSDLPTKPPHQPQMSATSFI